MRAKRFVALSMQEAMAKVRAEFGPDALILKSRAKRPWPIIRYFRQPRYEIVAVPGDRSEQTAPVAVLPESTVRDVVLSPTVSSSQHTPTLGTRRNGTQFIAPAPRGKQQRPVQRMADNGAAVTKNVFTELHSHLERQGVDETLCEHIVRYVAAQATQHNPINLKLWVRQQAEQYMSDCISCIDVSRIGTEGRIVPLIGPTGVGKTTTVAKLAANFALLADKRVAIITLDTYRVAAAEQLRIYADLIEVPLEVAYAPDELSAALQRHEDKDIIFIDTAGRSQWHDEQIQKLQQFLAVINNPLTHLVLSATTKLEDMLAIVERFNVIPHQRIIVTKLDETRTFGNMFTLLQRTKKQLAYMTNGQNVPDDIEVAHAPRVASLVMGGKL